MSKQITAFCFSMLLCFSFFGCNARNVNPPDQLFYEDEEVSTKNPSQTGAEPIEYDLIDDYEDGLARVYIWSDDPWGSFLGFINEKGETVIPAEHFYPYWWTQDHYRTYPVFSEGMVALWNSSGDRIGYYDRIGKLVIPFDYTNAKDFSEGLAAVAIGETDKLTGVGMKWGYIDNAGKIIISFEYNAARSFSEGLAAVAIGVLDWQTEKGLEYGFIDKTGEIVIPLAYDFAGDFSEGMAGVCKDGQWGLIDKTGKVVIPLAYDRVGVFSEGLVSAVKDGMYGFLDETGTVVIPFDYIYDEYENDHMSPTIGFLHQYMPRFVKGRVVINFGRPEEIWKDIDEKGNLISSMRAAAE